MTFIDEITVLITAGKGGNGMVAYRREKYVEFGGPWGGTGGAGGNVYFVGHSGVNTLFDLRYRKHIKGENGSNGETKGCRGKTGEDTLIGVPLGSIFYNASTNEYLGEIKKDKERFLICKGGKGGLGNISLSTLKNPCPDYAEKGDLGETLEVKVVLKVLADVGLLGYPSVGKSSFISVVSNAKPKIADYHFTTLSPHLGLVERNEKSFVIADLPGIIKGASNGVGLGFFFLKHIERCKVFLHIIDCLSENCYQNYLDIREELKLYDEKLLTRNEIVVLNKTEMISELDLSKIISSFKDIKVIPISVHTHKNLDLVLDLIVDILNNYEEIKEDVVSYKKYTLDDVNYIDIELKDNIYYVYGNEIKLLTERCDFSSFEATLRYTKKLRELGVFSELEKKGCKNKDIINIYGYEFDFID
ncbi:MAG: GTPase ObgE [Acholeplasmatales bacterium]|jgi:GTP-binding protein|nr:GTPase ObgE [Acholeplasmatales bacterium]